MAPNLMLLFLPVPHCTFITRLLGVSRNRLIRYHRWVDGQAGSCSQKWRRWLDAACLSTQVAGPRNAVDPLPARHSVLPVLGGAEQVSACLAALPRLAYLDSCMVHASATAAALGSQPGTAPIDHPSSTLPPCPPSFWAEFKATDGKVNHLAGSLAYFAVLALWGTSLEAVRRRLYQVCA